jgi:hypothetical protein
MDGYCYGFLTLVRDQYVGQDMVVAHALPGFRSAKNMIGHLTLW